MFSMQRLSAPANDIGTTGGAFPVCPECGAAATLAGVADGAGPSGSLEDVVVRTRQRLAAYALVFDDAGRVLLSREPDARGRLGRWLLPGGGVEHGEHPEQAVIREVREETGLPVRVGALRDVVSDVARVGRRRRVLHTVRLIYRADVVPASPGSPGQLGDYARWCAPQEWQALPLEPFAARMLASGRA
jgi:8-oxo-dGTP pyrophosphatase MutT (NUDIX family)